MTKAERALLERVADRVVELCCYVGWDNYGLELNDALVALRREAEREEVEAGG